MAVWCPTKEHQGSASVELHFNLWRLPRRGIRRKFRTWKWRNAADFIEVGVLLDHPDQVTEISIFLPFPVVSTDVEDCGPRFREQKIAEGIFNENISVEIPPAQNGAYVELKVNGGLFCRVHQFEKTREVISSNHLTLTPIDQGTVLKITQNAVEAAASGVLHGGKTYFRLRVNLPHASTSPFVQPVRPSDWALQSGFEAIELINFRLNEMRTLPGSVQNSLRSNGAAANAKVRLVAFLAAVPVISDMTSSNTPSHKSRTLEADIWNNYVKDGLPEDVAVYHWKKSRDLVAGEDPIGDFSAFVKLKQRRAGLGTVAVYLLVAFVFGVLGNLTASWLEGQKATVLGSQSEQAAVQQNSPDVAAGQ